MLTYTERNPGQSTNEQFVLCFLAVSVEAAGGKALACVVDIRDEQQIEEAVQKAVDKFGGLQFLLLYKPRELFYVLILIIVISVSVSGGGWGW